MTQSRDTPHKRNSLEGLRGVAALLVALFHLTVWSDTLPLIRHGYLFVDLFFVLSGFVIAGAYSARLGSTSQLAGFLLRRFGRLFPVLLVSTVLFVLAQNALPLVKQQMLAAGISGSSSNADQLAFTWPTSWEILTTVTFTHGMGTHDKMILNFVSWSISVEFWAYMLFATIAFFLPARRIATALIGLSAVGLLLTVWASIGKHQCLSAGACLDLVYDFAFARCVFSFFMGAAVWQVRSVGRRHEVRVQVLALLALLAMFWGVDELKWLAFAFPFAFAAMIWSIAEDRGPIAHILMQPAATKLGQWSYSIYMLHPVLLMLAYFRLVHQFYTPWVGPAIVASYVALLLVSARWMYNRIENPARRIFNELAARVERTGGREAKQVGGAPKAMRPVQ